MLSLAPTFSYKEYCIPKSQSRTFGQWEQCAMVHHVQVIAPLFFSFTLPPDIPSSLLRPFKLPLRHFWMPPEALLATSETLPDLLEAL